MQCTNCQGEIEAAQRFCKNCGTPAPEPDVDPLIGKSIGGKYRIVKLLGEGGMGAVYHGEQQLGTNVRRVAIKTLHKQLSTDPKVKARFNRECGTVAGLEHPNTIQVFDFGTTDDGQLYIVMEFVQGKSLADTLERDGAMPPERVEHILRQVCGSLEEAHAQGIVHRDLKPDNIVLTERAGQQDFVKVLDFGIAKRSGEEDKNEAKLTQAGMVLGTPPYMSPEQFTGKPIDQRSDIYSLGVMAYEMLTGKLPFEAETAWEWATKHMTVAPFPMETRTQGLRAPEKMRQAVMRALAKPVEQRFQNVKEFIEGFSVGAPLSTYMGGPSPVPGAPHTELLGGGQAPGPRISVISNPGDPVSGRAVTQGDLGAMSAPGFAGGVPQTIPQTVPSPGGHAVSGPGQTVIGPGGPGFIPGTGGPGVPTGGNVAYPAPPVQPKSGSGKMVAFILVGLLVAGGAAAGIFFATRKSPNTVATQTPSTATTPGAADAGLAATGEDSGSHVGLNPGAADAEAHEDAGGEGEDAGEHHGWDAGSLIPPPPLHDAGHVVHPPGHDAGHEPPHPDPHRDRLCREAANLKASFERTHNAAIGRLYESTAQQCRNAGGTAP